jgi:hypothetical protein
MGFSGVQIPVPQNRMTPLKTAWMQLYTPITDNLKLDMRMNLKTKKVRTEWALGLLQHVSFGALQPSVGSCSMHSRCP